MALAIARAFFVSDRQVYADRVVVAHAGLFVSEMDQEDDSARPD